MLSVVDETEDDWQAITALGSWAEFDAFFAEKYIDSECFAAVGGVPIGRVRGPEDHHAIGRFPRHDQRRLPPRSPVRVRYVYNNVVCAYLYNVWCACAYNQK